MIGQPLRAARPLTIVVALLTVAACATHRGSSLPPLGEDFELRARFLGDIDAWELTGRIGIRTVDDAVSGSLRWHQDGHEIDASMHGPFGAGGVRLSGSGDRLTVARGDGEIVDLVDPERELLERYGWTVPVSSFRYWVLGIADPSRPATDYVVDDGLLRTLTQGGWNIVYREYQAVSDSRLPKKLVAESGDIRLTVSIRGWRIPY